MAGDGKRHWPSLKCVVCGKTTPTWARYQRKTCSNKCHRFFIGELLGKYNKRTEVRKIRSEANKGEKHPHWAGDKVSYGALHEWVRRYLKKTKFCEECGKVPPIDLANKGKYTRDFDQWEWLCRRCHLIKDGRASRFWRFAPQHLRRLGIPPPK